LIAGLTLKNGTPTLGDGCLERSAKHTDWILRAKTVRGFQDCRGIRDLKNQHSDSCI